ncbi:hypothetical protein [Verminephrobacter eiseniae]|uniref:hypothetical protein n=1 Tax=Verminephrobacter eiseniae TaxID=364317 RepID=UPI001E2B9901|nr:hypothetical protein [Verminephrobacter eiseniae]
MSRHRSSVGLRWPSKRIAALHRLPIRSVWAARCALRCAPMAARSLRHLIRDATPGDGARTGAHRGRDKRRRAAWRDGQRSGSMARPRWSSRPYPRPPQGQALRPLRVIRLRAGVVMALDPLVIGIGHADRPRRHQRLGGRVFQIDRQRAKRTTVTPAHACRVEGMTSTQSS